MAVFHVGQIFFGHSQIYFSGEILCFSIVTTALSDITRAGFAGETGTLHAISPTVTGGRMFRMEEY